MTMVLTSPVDDTAVLGTKADFGCLCDYLLGLSLRKTLGRLRSIRIFGSCVIRRKELLVILSHESNIGKSRLGVSTP